MRSDGAWDVFISYAREDLAAARDLRNHLQAAGWVTFLSDDDLNLQVGSTQWGERIDQVLDASAVLVLLVTPRALHSRWVSYEWRSVHEGSLSGRRGMVVPLCWEGPAPDELPRALRSYQSVDAREADQRGRAAQAVSTLVQGYLAEVGQPSSLRPISLTQRPVMASPHPIAWLGAALLALPLLLLLPISAPWRRPDVAAQRTLQLPHQGLRVLSIFENPEDKTVGEIRSVGAWQEAASDFEQAARQPGAPIRWRSAQQLAVAQVALLSGTAEAAVAAMRRALSLDSGWAAAYVALSDALLEHDPHAALDAAQKARTLDPTLWIAVAALGTAHLYQGDVERSIEEYRRALVLSKNASTVLGELALAMHAAGAEYDDESERLAKAALKRSDQLVSPHLVLAELALERGDGTQALLDAEAAVGLAPRDLRCHLALGDAFQLLHRAEDARAAWSTALRLSASSRMLGAPTTRLGQIKLALAQDEFPTTRTGTGTADQRLAPLEASSEGSRSGPPRDSRPGGAGLRSGPKSPGGGDRSSVRSGGSCDPNDPLCGL